MKQGKIFLLVVFMVCILTGCGRKSEFTYKELEDGTVCLLKYTGKDTVVALPSEIDGKVVSATCASFKDNRMITEVVIPDTVVSIEDGTFENAYCLQSVSGGKNVEKVGWRAFKNCISLEKIPEFPNLKEIGDRAFWGLNSLEELVIPESVTEIGTGAFFGEKVCLVVKAGSYAEEYAKENSILYETVEHVRE